MMYVIVEILMEKIAKLSQFYLMKSYIFQTSINSPERQREREHDT